MTAFETLYENVLKTLSEDMPVDLEPGINVGSGANVPVPFTDTANYKITPEQAARVIDSVIDYLHTRNGHSPLPYRSFQTDVIAGKIVLYSTLNPTKAVYAARVVYNAMKDAGFITDERNGTKRGTILLNNEPDPEEVDEVADSVAAETNTTEVVNKPEREKIEMQDEEEVSVFFKSNDFPVEEVTPEEEEELFTAWSTIPDGTDIEWNDIVKRVGLTKALKLKDIKALLPSSLSSVDSGNAFIEDEDEYVEPDDVTDTDRSISQTEVEREIEPSFRRSFSQYKNSED
jgi:hypothetical protein